MTMDCCSVHRQFNFTQQNRNFLLHSPSSIHYFVDDHAFVLQFFIIIICFFSCWLLLHLSHSFSWSWRSQRMMTIFYLAFIGLEIEFFFDFFAAWFSKNEEVERDWIQGMGIYWGFKLIEDTFMCFESVNRLVVGRTEFLGV